MDVSQGNDMRGEWRLRASTEWPSAKNSVKGGAQPPLSDFRRHAMHYTSDSLHGARERKRLTALGISASHDHYPFGIPGGAVIFDPRDSGIQYPVAYAGRI